MDLRFKSECTKLQVMSKVFQSRNDNLCKPENIRGTNNQNEPNDVTTKKTFGQSAIPVQKNGDPQKSVIEKPRTVLVQTAKQDGGVEMLMLPLWPTEETLAKSSILMAHEIKMRTVVTAQDRFRLRVPEPKNAIEKACRNCKLYYLHKPRHRKPLIVIDLDVLKLTSSEVQPSNGPTMLNLLEFLYRYFDIALWSSHKMSTVIPKLECCGYFQKQNKFKITFILDVTSITPTLVPIIGFTRVKDLDVIWKLYPHYNEHNCIMLNYNLKKVVYASYGVPIHKKQDKLVDEVAMTILIEFLVEAISSTQSLAKLNTPIWKKFDK